MVIDPGTTTPVTVPVSTGRRFDVNTTLFGRQQRRVLTGSIHALVCNNELFNKIAKTRSQKFDSTLATHTLLTSKTTRFVRVSFKSYHTFVSGIEMVKFFGLVKKSEILTYSQVRYWLQFIWRVRIVPYFVSTSVYRDLSKKNRKIKD